MVSGLGPRNCVLAGCVQWCHLANTTEQLCAVGYVGDRAFPIAAARTHNSLTQRVISAPSLPVFSPIFLLVRADLRGGGTAPSLSQRSGPHCHQKKILVSLDTCEKKIVIIYWFLC